MAVPADLLTQRLPWAAAADSGAAANVELRDQLDTYFPVQRELVQRLRAGEGADWLHDVSTGVPGTAFIGWGLWSPFNLPAAVLDFSLAWAWGMALRLFAAMAGAYLLVRRLGAGRLGGTVAGAAFGLSGFMVLWLGWPQSHVAAVAPWVWWATHRTVAEDAPWWAGPALAVSTAALWLGGFPAVSAYVLAAAGAVALHTAWPLRHRRRAALRGLGAAALAVSLGTGAAAFTLLPSLRILEEFSLGYRDQAWRTGLPTRALLTFVAPGFFGDVVHHRLWLGVSYVEAVAYTGVVSLLLGCLAWTVAPRRRGLGLFTAMAAGGLLLVYGLPPLRTLLSLAPMLRSNVPTRALAVVSLALAVLGGLGADALRRLLRGEAAWDRRAARATAVVAAGAGLAYVAMHPPGRLRELAYRRLPQEVAQRAGDVAGWEAAAAFGFVLLAAAVVTGALWLRPRAPRRAEAVLTGGLVAVLAWDLLAFAGGWNVQAPPAQLFPPVAAIQHLARTSVNHHVAGADDVLMPNTHLAYGVADIRAHAFVTRRFTDVLARLDARRQSPTLWDLQAVDSGQWRPWLPLLGVREVLIPDSGPRLGATLVRERHDDVGPALTEGVVHELEATAPRGGTLEGVLLRVGTYGRANDGELVVRVEGPAGAARGAVVAAGLRDLAWTFVPVTPLDVEEGERLRIEVEGTAARADQAVSVFGHRDGEEFTPALALHHGEELPSRPLADADGVRVVELPDALPLVFAAKEARPSAEGGALGAQALQVAQRDVVVVEPYGGRELPALPDGDGTAEVVSWSRAGGRVQAEVRSDRGAVVTTLDEALEGWTATVDGRPATVVRVNHLFTGVVVPRGVHTVELRYRAPLTAAGLVTSGRSVGAIVGWALLRRLRDRTGMSTRQLLLTAAHELQRRWIQRR
ncbi:MAG TPA: YfhO family protein [Egibacteraceae bacterium]|nr:YfhO family protein [Egibacteraceae bacterium]